ncbi:hypothetical protein [Acetivibrio cellulolyticus]
MNWCIFFEPEGLDILHVFHDTYYIDGTLKEQNLGGYVTTHLENSKGYVIQTE